MVTHKMTVWLLPMTTFRNQTSLIRDKWLLNEAFTCSKLAIETPKNLWNMSKVNN